MKLYVVPRSLAFALGLISTLGFSLITTFAQGTAFTYQGRLNDGAGVANGSYDVRFAIYDAPTLGTQQGPILTNAATAVSNGLFTVTLDFGNQFPGANRWLEIGVRTNGDGAFTTLTPRQLLTATPYAIQAGNAATATAAGSASSVSASNINGTLSLFQLPGAVVTNHQTGVNLSGSFTGNASGLSNLPVSAVVAATNFSVVAWGANTFGQTNVPAGLNNVNAVAAGSGHNLALLSDGTVVAWGDNDFNQTNVPAGLSNVTAVAAGSQHNLVLKRDGTVASWGGFDGSLFSIASGLSNVAAVAAGNGFSLVLRSNGTVFAWGRNDVGQTNVPAGLTGVTAVAAGGSHALALKADGTVVAWGWNDNGQANVPVGLSNVTALAAGGFHSLALKSDGTVIAWGDTGNGAANVPAGLTNVTAVTAGFSFSGALKADGTVEVWGFIGTGQASFAAGLNSVFALGTGGSGQNFLAIRKQLASPFAWLAGDNTFAGNINVNGNLQVLGVISGDAAGLTINASQLSSGTVPGARLGGVYGNALTFANAANSFSGNGAGLTSLNAFELSSGTVADARLSSNVALRSGGNAFTGNQTFNGGNVGIGLTPQSTLHVNGTARIEGANNWGVTGGEGDFRVGNDTFRFKIGVANGGGGAGDVWMRAHGGIERINVKAPGGTRILSNEAETSGVSLAAGGTAWAVISDRNIKKDFAKVDSVQILEKLAAMPITQWHYQWEHSDVTPHIGPMAQDFKAAFYPGADDKSITTQEADGVALAAIQGLNQKLEETRAENADLKQQLSELKQLVQTLLAKP